VSVHRKLRGSRHRSPPPHDRGIARALDERSRGTAAAPRASLIAERGRSLRGRYDIDEQDRRDDPAPRWPPFERDVTVGLVLRPRFDTTLICSPIS
jgi:hypothetical protein